MLGDKKGLDQPERKPFSYSFSLLGTLQERQDGPLVGGTMPCQAYDCLAMPALALTPALGP